MDDDSFQFFLWNQYSFEPQRQKERKERKNCEGEGKNYIVSKYYSVIPGKQQIWNIKIREFKKVSEYKININLYIYTYHICISMYVYVNLCLYVHYTKWKDLLTYDLKTEGIRSINFIIKWKIRTQTTSTEKISATHKTTKWPHFVIWKAL